MGSVVRQRLIAHLSRGEPCFRSCPRRLGFPAQSYATAAGSGNDEAASSSSSSSWFQRLKGVFKGTTSSETHPQTQQPNAPEPMASDPKATLPGDFTMESKCTCSLLFTVALLIIIEARIRVPLDIVVFL
jgi:hypothetical protein